MKSTKKTNNGNVVTKIKTTIAGFDQISNGGIPEGRTTLISGTTGAGKTIFALQFLVGGIEECGEHGVFVTFEEKPVEIIKNMNGFGWNLDQLIKEEKFAFVNASPAKDDTIEVGEFDLAGFLAQIMVAVDKVGAKRVVIDSLSSLFTRFSDQGAMRRELYRIASHLNEIGLTTIITAERTAEEQNTVSRFGIEEFVSDNVILLHNYLDPIRKDRQRSVEILKYRGTGHDTLDTPMLVTKDGMEVYPRPKPDYSGHRSSNEKISTGIVGLDNMLLGGVYKNSATLVTGASGSGKTVTALHFLMEGIKQGEKGLYIAFEESDEQLFRNAESFGWDLKGAVEKGQVILRCSVPEELKPEEHYKHIKELIEGSSIDRFVVDSLSALERIYAMDRFREFTIGLNAFLKEHGVTSYLTNTTASLLDVAQITETHLSTATDNIVLLKYVELDGQMKRAISVVKARGTDHDKRVRENVINSTGLKILSPFVGVENLMGGSARRVMMPSEEAMILTEKFDQLRSDLIDGVIALDEYETRTSELRDSLNSGNKD